MIDPTPERITWYYGEWQVAYENLDIPNMHLEEGLKKKNEEEEEEEERFIFPTTTTLVHTLNKFIKLKFYTWLKKKEVNKKC